MMRINAQALSRSILAAVFAVSLAAIPLDQPSPAHAGELTPSGGANTMSQDGACWMEAEGRSACAATQAELAELVYNEYGVVFVAPASGKALPESLMPPDDAVGVATAQATYVMGIIYADAGMAGDSFTQTSSLDSEPCDAYGDYTYGAVHNLNVIDGYFGTSWNDRVSSFEGYGMCGYEMWADGGWQGSSVGPSGSASSLGAFNDQASSLKVRKVA